MAEKQPAEDQPGDGRAEGKPARDAVPTATRARPSTATAAAHQVALIVAAAEHAAEELRLETEERMRSRIAEGERAAEYRVQAAEDEATEIITSAQEEAARLRETSREESEAAKTTATSQAQAIVAQAQERAAKAIERATATAEKSTTNCNADIMEIMCVRACVHTWTVTSRGDKGVHLDACFCDTFHSYGRHERLR